VGNISGPNTFDPQHAIILQNKDEVILPLLVETLPTPKEFKDAIESLSPEQKRFATAFRNMQLESSVFGVCVIQLKPQLEAVLSLPNDSLTKEIRLTQDLLSLFIDYHIPSDLLTYDGDADASVSDKVARVKTHVAAVQEMIEDAKAKEVEDAKKEAELKKEQLRHHHEVLENMAVFEADKEVQRFSRRLSRMQPEAMIMATAVEPMMMDGAQSLRGHHVHKESSPKQVSPQHTEQQHVSGKDTSSVTDSGNTEDFTLIPRQLDAQFEALDTDSALRPSKIKIGSEWTTRTQKSLLSPLKTEPILTDEQKKKEKDKAFDLLDALSKSGALPIAHAELHVLVAATHQFDKSLIATVIEDNINPIEKMEKSLLIVSSTINGVPPVDLLSNDQIEEVAKYLPILFDSEGSPDPPVQLNVLQGTEVQY